ncbi:hydrogen peroxide-inducible genes activator [Sphingomonas lenta]|uniref:DNA-binding transcriptional regulator OxyR n=1 Tax=Sphingomonas lenta TaxID=1141887 RepID=A0A2A2SI14_9SPHN|nr:hydrogen peroxide-inducible genes activator [Sphingomonas lenta]PAX08858.1 DNA-binding transcriptional regulator OxyR [Sphingomonas lenta]
MPTLRQLSYLVTLADCGSFVHASRLANVSQPTLSQQIKALEDRLRVKLVDRGTSGAILTPIGRSIVAKARGVLSEVRDIEALAASASDQLSGTLRLGTTPTLGPYLLSPMIAELHRIAPELRLYIREGIPDQQALELSRGELDVHLGPLPIVGDDLAVEPLFREPLLLVCAVDCELATGRVLEPADLAGQPVISLDARHHFHRQTAEIAKSYGMRLSPDYEGTSLDSLHQMAASGLGLTVLPALYLASDVGGSTGLAVLKVAGWKAHRSVALAWRQSSSMAPAFRIIAEQVQAAARLILDPIVAA